MGGDAALGAITMFGPDGNDQVQVHDVAFAFTETTNRDGSIDFSLTEFSADADTAAYSSFVLSGPSMRLAQPASGSLVGETVSFPPGALRMSVTASVSANGEVLFDGQPVTGEYVNTGIATAKRGLDGTFSFSEAPFATAGYLFVLNTEDGSFQPR